MSCNLSLYDVLKITLGPVRSSASSVTRTIEIQTKEGLVEISLFACDDDLGLKSGVNEELLDIRV